MRLFLLPISTRRSLLYCQRLAASPSSSTSSSTSTISKYTERITQKASTTWLEWERKESGWQKKVVVYGNKLFQRLPYQEYGLKSVPPLTRARRDRLSEWAEKKLKAGRRREALGTTTEGNGKSDTTASREEQGTGSDVAIDDSSVSVEFPEGLVQEEDVWEEVRRLGSDETQKFHTKWLYASVAGMPAVAPFAIVPIVPNLPFFYLCFRAWSNWRARSGSEHLEFLLDKQLIRLHPSTQLRRAYTEAALDVKIDQIDAERKESASASSSTASRETEVEDGEEMLITKSSGTVIAKWLDIPEIHTEIDRAVWQVERSIRARQELNEEKAELNAANRKVGK